MTSLSGRMDRMTNRELLEVFGATARFASSAMRQAGPLAPAKGPRAVRRRRRATLARLNARRRHQVACRAATVAINAHGFYIAPRATKINRVMALVRKLGV
jgi:hypothetical protein